MSKIWVARRAPRKSLMLPMQHTSSNPALLFPLMKKTDPSELDELVRAQLEKQGITKDSDVQAVVDKAESAYELSVKTDEARKEFRRLMAERLKGNTLMQVGYRKWKPVFYPAVRK